MDSLQVEVKVDSEKEVESSESKAMMWSSYIEKIKKEIDEATDNQVLIDLARLEVEGEIRDIEAQRASEAARFSAAIKEAKMGIKHHRVQIRRAKEHEKMLAITTSDVKVLQNEMAMLRAMDSIFKENQANIMAEELEAAKKELTYFKNRGFELMDTMDIVRRESTLIRDESRRLTKLNKMESSVHHLNSKLLKAKSKLESASSAEERSQAITHNLLSALQQLKTDIEEAKEEEELANGETKAIKIITNKINSDIDATESRLQSTIEELEAVKTSEAIALATLSSVSQERMRTLARSLNSTITISKFEYEYLRNRAEAAEGVAEEKVAAARLWVEALEASKRELAFESELIEREIEGYRVSVVSECDSGSDEEANKPLELLKFEVPMERALGWQKVGESKMVKVRRSSASTGRRRNSSSRTPSCVVKKKREGMNNLVGFLKGRRIIGNFKTGVQVVG